jgi:ketosteroid isomerase-like protein
MAEGDQDLVELTRRSMQATNEGDFDAAMAAFAEDAAFDVSAAGVGRFEGRAAVRSYLEDWIGSYERQELSRWDGVDLGGGVVFVDAQLEALPAGSTASVRERWAFTAIWSAGAIAEVVASQDVDGARGAAGELAAAVTRASASGNVALVLASLRHWRATGEPAWAICREDVEVHDHDILDAGEYRGRDGFERWMADWSAAWSSFEMTVDDVIDAGNDRVVVLARMQATGRGSSVSVEREDALVYEVRDGLISRVDYFNDRGRALEAAGVGK